MEALPSYVQVLVAGYSDSDFDPSVLRTEMERGVAKQRIKNSQVTMKINATLLFDSEQDADAFEDWYFDTINRIEEFTMLHPRRKIPIVARFEGGRIGKLMPRNPRFTRLTRDVVLEYQR
ncbi:hypothetical protein DYQ93_11465 [Xanthomonas sp. LMG 8992]|uniref:hypothetical protein n=1 Tax=Xanthomonas sp. LMG 8992 TaxID=1591157 RepID=UPI00136C51C3|nr:hypothetical protein [Xanthomonas sp. LMG 8992]MXV11638.1 hypothetical protein [Xanthomonas sp. LMG 8992]